jgi:hypothetical protein
VLAVLAVAATVLTGCAHTPHVRPAQVVFACGDGNFYATALHWSHWGSSDAEAAGTGHQNDCTPDCAGGKFHAYPLSVRLSRPVVCVHGRREFSRLAWTFTAAKPARVAHSGGEVLPCSFLKLKP